MGGGEISGISFGVNSKQKKKTDHWKALEKVGGGEETEAPKGVDIACGICFMW